MANGQSPITPRKIGRVAPRAPRLPTGRSKCFQGDACNHGAVPRLRIQVAVWLWNAFVPANHCAMLAARCGERALPSPQNRHESW
jgi:hypothetical protein